MCSCETQRVCSKQQTSVLAPTNTSEISTCSKLLRSLMREVMTVHLRTTSLHCVFHVATRVRFRCRLNKNVRSGVSNWLATGACLTGHRCTSWTRVSTLCGNIHVHNANTCMSRRGWSVGGICRILTKIRISHDERNDLKLEVFSWRFSLGYL